MDFITLIMWVTTWVLVILPLIGWVVWWWNDLWYATLKLKFRGGLISGTKLPPGHMGVPFFGEMLLFLWYFKVLRRPDDYINSKRHMYGDGIGLYRSHLFGSPAIIACSPMVNKFVLQSDSNFIVEWPTVELVGTTSLAAVHGEGHTRLRIFVQRAVNQPEALSRIALILQPRLIAALQSWAQRGTIVAFKEAKKVTFENIGKLFVSFEPGPVLDNLDTIFTELVHGVRAYPINFPGTAFHRALQCRKDIMKIFIKELEKRKKKNDVDGAKDTDDLMDGLMRLKDDEGKQLSDTEILDNIITLVLGGYVSTSLAIMWALYYLAIYPNVLQKLREENMSLSKNKNGGLITIDDIATLKYTNKVVEETIRLANIAGILFRKATKDVEYKGHTIPKGWKVILWNRYLHTNPENFEDPMCFNPDRWNEAAKAGAYQVFGGGPRICAGNMLARLQLALLIHHLATGYKWELVDPNAKMDYLPHPKPVDGAEIAFTKL